MTNQADRPSPIVRFAADAILATTDRLVTCEGALVRSNRDRTGKLTVLCSLMDGQQLGSVPANVHSGSAFFLSPADARNLAEALIQAAGRAEKGEADPEA
jgi:hypothetical protein